MTAGRTPEWRDVAELRTEMTRLHADFADVVPRVVLGLLDQADCLPGRAARVLTEQEGGPPNERWERAGDGEPRLDHFLATLDRMVNEDRIDDPRKVRAALDEAQATIRRLRSGGGVIAGQDEPRELRGLIHDALQTVAEAVTELRQTNPEDLGVDDLDAARRKLIRARAIADHAAAAPVVDTAEQDPPVTHDDACEHTPEAPLCGCGRRTDLRSALLGAGVDMRWHSSYIGAVVVDFLYGAAPAVDTAGQDEPR